MLFKTKLDLNLFLSKIQKVCFDKQNIQFVEYLNMNMMNDNNFDGQFHQIVKGEKSVMNKSQIELLDNSIAYHCEIKYENISDEWKLLFVLDNGINSSNQKIFTLETMRGNIRFFKKLQTAIEFVLAECKQADYFLIKKDNRIYKIEEITQK